jgi:hypothetical protein
MNQSSQLVRPPRRTGSRGRRTRPGRAGVTTAAALIATLGGAGLVVGCASHPSSASATPTVVVTKTVAAAPASDPAADPSAPASAASSPATPTPSGPAATTGDGSQLGAYSFQLTYGYGAPLGSAAPTQSQMVSASSAGPWDISYNGYVYPGSDEKMISLPDGATPTYSACTTGTTFIQDATPDKGTAFCIIETNGQVAGVVISGLNSSPANTASFKVTAWKYVP